MPTGYDFTVGATPITVFQQRGCGLAKVAGRLVAALPGVADLSGCPASPPARLRRGGRPSLPGPCPRCRRCRPGGSVSPSRCLRSTQVLPWRSFRSLLPTGRHDALRSLYRRSRRKLPTGRPSWPGTEARVPPGAHGAGGSRLLPIPWPVPSTMNRTNTMAGSPHRLHPPIALPSARRASVKPMGGYHRCCPSPGTDPQSQRNLTAEERHERYRRLWLLGEEPRPPPSAWFLVSTDGH